MAQIRFYSLGSSSTNPFNLDVTSAGTMGELLALVMSKAPANFRPTRMNFIVNSERVYQSNLAAPTPRIVTHVVVRETAVHEKRGRPPLRPLYVVE